MFIASILCTPLIKDTKRINFVWGKQKSVKKTISPKYNFFPMVGPLYSHWQQCPSKKLYRQRIFPLSLFSKYKFNNYSHHFFVPHWSFITNFSKVFSEGKVFCEKNVLQKRNFLSYLRNIVLPLIALSKKFFKKNTYQKKTIFSKLCFFIFIRKYPHWWNLQNQSNLFSESNFQWKKRFL